MLTICFAPSFGFPRATFYVLKNNLKNAAAQTLRSESLDPAVWVGPQWASLCEQRLMNAWHEFPALTGHIWGGQRGNGHLWEKWKGLFLARRKPDWRTESEFLLKVSVFIGSAYAVLWDQEHTLPKLPSRENENSTFAQIRASIRNTGMSDEQGEVLRPILDLYWVRFVLVNYIQTKSYKDK